MSYLRTFRTENPPISDLEARSPAGPPTGGGPSAGASAPRPKGGAEAGPTPLGRGGGGSERAFRAGGRSPGGRRRRRLPRLGGRGAPSARRAGWRGGARAAAHPVMPWCGSTSRQDPSRSPAEVVTRSCALAPGASFPTTYLCAPPAATSVALGRALVGSTARGLNRLSFPLPSITVQMRCAALGRSIGRPVRQSRCAAAALRQRALLARLSATTSTGRSASSGRLLDTPHRSLFRAFAPTAPRTGASPGSVRLTARASSTSSKLNELTYFLEEVAVTGVPVELGALVNVLQSQGETLVSAQDRSGLMPLLIPLSKDEATGHVTALLREPRRKQEGSALAVVRSSAHGLTLLAKDARSYLCRALVEEELAGGSALSSMVQEEGLADVYETGDVTNSPYASRPEVYLTTKVGAFPDVMEGLAAGHVAKGDETSALTTCEWYMRKHFPEWGRSYYFNSVILTHYNRLEEARDMARFALRCPWYTLGNSLDEVRTAAGFEGKDLEELKSILQETPKQPGGVPKPEKDPREKALDMARDILDLTAGKVNLTGDISLWDGCRGELSEQFEKAELAELASFVAPSP
eukprot:scaffold4120_cov400-Prasinococcus_capsulatus_cf.AAC.10